MFYLPKPVLRAANVGGGATQVRPAELQADAIACESLVNSSDREQLSVAEDILTAAGEKNHVASHRQPQLVPSVARSWCSWQSALQLEPTAAAAAKPASVQPAATPAEAQERGDASESDRDEARPALARVDRNEQSLADDIGRQRGGRDGQWRRGRLAPRALRRLRAVDGLYL